MSNDGRRSRLSSQARREQLLGIGVDMVQDKRLEELSIDDIAGRAEISRGLLFHYFDSMQDFQLAVAERIINGLVDRLSIADDPARPGSARLVESLDAYIDYIAAHPEVYRSVVRGASSGHERMRAMADDARGRIVDMLLENVAALADAPDDVLADPAIRMCAYAWIAMNEELVLRWLADPVMDRAALIGRMVAPLPALLGLENAAASSPPQPLR